MSEASLMPSQRSQSSFTPKQIAEFYFKPYLTEDGDPTGLQVCKACGDLLDGLLEVKPSFRHYLAPDADIVAAPEFESAVIKVLGGRAKLLSCAEKAALKPFERKTAEAADVTEKTAKVGFADRILKRRKVQEDKSAYSQLNAIPPTSNAAERLFSMARMVLRYERNRLSPLMLEMLLFLKLNSKYWDVTTVDAVI
ncbi:hypothetical protein F443_22029 [Phytophthora nicotianae P1569]|uniref:HAT C-terminal dimerisation domain-containing protein n=1 Tax=Phytophthora nicotianae P1569 TaxID=1317065 RepID=V9DVK1_PHYNI|nr:hypothetical protein F443_22029 [Phytophthora nicotianae P1569]